MRRAKKKAFRRMVCIPFRSEEELALLDIAADDFDTTIGEFLRLAMYDRIEKFSSIDIKAKSRDVLQRSKASKYIASDTKDLI